MSRSPNRNSTMSAASAAFRKRAVKAPAPSRVTAQAPAAEREVIPPTGHRPFAHLSAPGAFAPEGQGDTLPCRRCDGTGEAASYTLGDTDASCDRCAGSGEEPAEPCNACQGDGCSKCSDEGLQYPDGEPYTSNAKRQDFAAAMKAATGKVRDVQKAKAPAQGSFGGAVSEAMKKIRG